MKKKRYISQILIAAFFLASYSGVYATYFICNLVPLVIANTGHSHDHANHDSDNHHEPISHNHNGQKHDHENHGDDHHEASGRHNHDDSHSHDHGATMDECCNDQTVPFINSLPKLSLKQFQFEFAVSQVPIIHSHLVLDSPYQETHPKLVRYIHPPPKVPDIRIFIQSFII